MTAPVTEEFKEILCFFDFITPDVEKTSKFFTELFGWEFVYEGTGDSKYLMAKANGKYFGSVLEIKNNSTNTKPRVIPCIRVKDLNETTTLIQRHGGTIDPAKAHTEPNVGSWNYFQSKSGVEFGLFQNTEVYSNTSVVVWNELVIKKGTEEEEKKFLTSVFPSWAMDDKDYETMKYSMMRSKYDTSQESYIGGIDCHGDEKREVYWRIYVDVGYGNVDKVAEKAKSLGSTVEKEPFDDPEVGRMCHLLDPTGIHFSLFAYMEPPKDDAKKEGEGKEEDSEKKHKLEENEKNKDASKRTKVDE